MQIFPNPLCIGEPLTMENLEPGSRVELLDVSGRVRAAWRAERGRMSRPVEGLAPGLYFIRAQEAGSGSRVVRKLLLMR